MGTTERKQKVDEGNNFSSTNSWKNDYIKVADQLYRDRNPEGKMNTPNGVYITVERWWHEFNRKQPENISFYEWCLQEKK